MVRPLIYRESFRRSQDFTTFRRLVVGDRTSVSRRRTQRAPNGRACEQRFPRFIHRDRPRVATGKRGRLSEAHALGSDQVQAHVLGCDRTRCASSRPRGHRALDVSLINGAAPIAELEVLADLIDAGELAPELGRWPRRPRWRQAAAIAKLEVLADLVDAGELAPELSSDFRQVPRCAGRICGRAPRSPSLRTWSPALLRPRRS